VYYVGLDVHKSRSSMTILDQNGAVFKRLEVKGPWPKLMETVAREVPRPFRICYEASCGYGYLHDQLRRLAEQVSVAHPGHLRLIFRSKKKNDRVDAAKLAKLLYLEEVPAVHVPSVDVRAWRGLIEYRRRLLQSRTGVKNQVRALLRGLGIATAAGRGLWTRRGIKELQERELQESDRLRLEIMLEELSGLTAKVKRVEKELAAIAARHPGVTLLKTIPGVGVRTAEAFVAYVDDVRRFARVSQIGSYFGLVPCQDASADRNRLGHITRDGPSCVRALACEAAWQGVRRSATVKAFFERVMKGDEQRKKIALVATAHYLIRVMGAMLKSGEVWREAAERTKTVEGVETAAAETAPAVMAPAAAPA
jgi:transposase